MAFVVVGHLAGRDVSRVLAEFADAGEADRQAALFREHLEDYRAVEVVRVPGPADRVFERDVAPPLPPGPWCDHCGARGVVARGLCRRCYETPAVRRKFPARGRPRVRG